MDQDAPFREGIIAPAKLADYLLKIRHKDGGPKANFFIHTCGFSRQRPRELARALHGQLAGAVYMDKRPSRRGTNHRFCGHIISPRKGKILVTTIWHVSGKGAIPQLATARPAKKKEAEFYLRRA